MCQKMAACRGFIKFLTYPFFGVGRISDPERCECGPNQQIVAHIVNRRRMFAFNAGISDIHSTSPRTIELIVNPTIQM